MEQGDYITAAVINDLVYDQRMIRICRSLSRIYCVTLVGRQLPESIALNKEPYQQYRFTCLFNKGKLFYLEYNLRLFIHLLSGRVDTFIAVDLDTLPATWLAAKIRRKKLVYDAHEWFTEVPELQGRPLSKKVWSLVGNWLIPSVNLAYTVCDSLAEKFTELYGKPFQVVSNMPYKRSVEKSGDANQLPARSIIYQGALNEGRGLEVAIRAMSHLTYYHLILVGEGDLSEELRELAAEQKASDRIRFMGKLSPEALHELTPHAWLGLNLLESRSLNYYYSLANKFLDYIQAGIPSINMAFPEYESIFTRWEAGVLLDELTVDALVTAVKKLDRDEDFYKKKVAATKDAADILCWENEEGKLLALFRDL